MSKIKNKIIELHELLESSTDSREQELRNYLYDLIVSMNDKEDIKEKEKPVEKPSKSVIDSLFD